MNKLWISGAILLAVYAWGQITAPGEPFDAGLNEFASSASKVNSSATDSSRILGDAYSQRASNLQVEGNGVVSRVLTDDNNGSRHQRFILTLASGQTLLVAHNIDLAPRVASIAPGDRVDFFGEYEWNAQGGVIHWTHKDPQGRHVAGWLRHNGRTYQ
jgi:hypothetical protein